jgi:hypothetical protein
VEIQNRVKQELGRAGAKDIKSKIAARKDKINLAPEDAAPSWCG